MFNKPFDREINLNLKTHNVELSSNGFLTAVSGLGFITAGLLLERKRIEQKLKDAGVRYNEETIIDSYLINR
jgi:hypothetical protein